MRCVIRVVGGPVWQWDLGRRVSAGWAGQVHFARPGDDEALVSPVGDDGTAEVPSQLLLEPGDVLCWAVLDGSTRATLAIPVVGRPQPSDWAYTPTEVETVEGVKAWVEGRISELQESGGVSYGHGLKVVDGRLVVDTADAVEADNTLPVTSAAVHVEVGNIEALLRTI